MPFLLATLGGCSPHKGIDQLLEMMPYLDSHIHLLVAGSVLTPLESANSLPHSQNNMVPRRSLNKV